MPLAHSITHLVAANGIYAVLTLMLVDAVFPAASEPQAEPSLDDA